MSLRANAADLPHRVAGPGSPVRELRSLDPGSGDAVNIWRWIAEGGVVLALVGIVALIWEEVALPASPFGDSALSRWQTAMAPLFLTALGLLVITCEHPHARHRPIQRERRTPPSLARTRHRQTTRHPPHPHRPHHHQPRATNRTGLRSRPRRSDVDCLTTPGEHALDPQRATSVRSARLHKVRYAGPSGSGDRTFAARLMRRVSSSMRSRTDSPRSCAPS
jgi:hypothetical protein